MIKIAACIFDLDGVIVDTAKYHFLAWQKLAQSIKLSFSKTDNEKLKGVSREHSLEIILQINEAKLSDGEKYELLKKKNNWYLDYISQIDDSELLPGVKKLFDELKEQEIGIALGSASKNAVMILRQVGMIHYFDAIIDGTKVSQVKPRPEVFLKGAHALRVLPAHCVVFEDAQSGIEAANRAGMYSIGIGNSDVLGEANLVFNSFEDFNFKTMIGLLNS